MLKQLFFACIATALLASAGCGLVGWQGEPPNPGKIITATGTVLSEPLTERDSTIWILKADTASYVPDDLPDQFQEDSLKVRATGKVGDPPEYYPSARLLQVQRILRLDE